MQVKNGHNSNDKDILKDFCDGSYFREHQLFGIHPANTLQIFLYFDEVEICNPLGSKAKIHKLSKPLIYIKLHGVDELHCM